MYRKFTKWWPRTLKGFVSGDAYLIAGWFHDITFYMEDGLPWLVSSYDRPYLQGIYKGHLEGGPHNPILRNLRAWNKTNHGYEPAYKLGWSSSTHVLQDTITSMPVYVQYIILFENHPSTKVPCRFRQARKQLTDMLANSHGQIFLQKVAKESEKICWLLQGNWDNGNPVNFHCPLWTSI